MWPKLRLPFDVRRNGEPIQEYEVRHGVNPNITFGRLLPNLVPLYEELEACRHANYNYTEWKGLTYREKAMHVMEYRLKKLVDLHRNDAVTDRMERDNKRAESKARKRK